MALQSSGAISFSNIKTELSNSSNSLRALSALAGFSTPDSMSEFYGYTNATAPLVGNQATYSPTNITTTSATLNGLVIFGSPADGGSPITEVGFYFGTSSNYTANPKYSIPFNSSNSSISYNISGLNASSTYYYKLYAKNAVGETLAQHGVSFVTPFQVQTINFRNLPYDASHYSSSLFYWYCTNRNIYTSNPLSIGYIDPTNGALINIQSVNAYASDTGQYWRFYGDFPLYVEAIFPTNAKGVFYTDPWGGTSGYGGADVKFALNYGAAYQFDTSQTEVIGAYQQYGIETNIQQFLWWQCWNTVNYGTVQMKWRFQ